MTEQVEDHRVSTIAGHTAAAGPGVIDDDGSDLNFEDADAQADGLESAVAGSGVQGASSGPNVANVSAEKD